MRKLDIDLIYKVLIKGLWSAVIYGFRWSREERIMMVVTSAKTLFSATGASSSSLKSELLRQRAVSCPLSNLVISMSTIPGW